MKFRCVLFLVITSILFISCGYDVPDSQQEFINKWKTIKKGYKNADTSSETKRWKDKGYNFLKNNKSKVDKWYGKVKDVYTTNSVVVEHKGIEYTLKPKTKNNSGSIGGMKKGEKVLFSGYLNGESSLTTGGAISEPEMNVILYELTNIDLSYTYFETSNTKPPETTESRSSISKTCQLDGCNRSGTGWRYYTGSDLPSYRYSCVRLGPSTGHSLSYTYCTKSHCIEDQ